MVDYAVQRTNMVESQVRPSDVTDRRILRVMQAEPREQFVTGPAQALAYMDDHLPAGGGRFLLAPRVLAKLIQLLEIQAGDTVLDVGCATGYSAAVLARLAGAVIAVEADEKLAEQARRTLAARGIDNADLVAAPLPGGVPARAPYDAILLNGSVELLPEAIVDQLKDGGRVAGVLVAGGVGKATLWRRSGPNCDGRPAFDAAAPLLPGFEKARSFVF
jgi:protein-L-isoaspartate(D-aspartate) O-methyltransferase